jgi:hypothetical protein
MSLVTSIKDYIEVVHKLIETDPNFHLPSYYDFGAIVTFLIVTLKNGLQGFLSFQWLQNIWSIPTLIPDIASAVISEVSVFDGYFQSTQTFLENPISYGNQNLFIYCVEKFMIGFFNSVFLCFPTSIAHIITLRRFVMQGLEAGFISGLGTIAGNLVWIGSIVFGLRFLVIPWLSLDLFRYFLGFLLIVKYMWDSYTERRMVLEDLSKYKIFFLTFLLSFTEQTTLYPFLSNVSFGSDSTLFESFPTANFSQFAIVHCCYLLGILLGSLSFLQFTCWFWENPAFQIYMWFVSSFKTTTSFYSKFVNLTFLYLTMICAISNVSYFGLDYTLTNPLGFVHEDRLLDQKALIETAFLNTKASDRNTRRNRGRHGRRERWKRRVRRYRTFDASLYDQGIYDLFTIEDLNYGFDRFWLRRKIRNHRVRFRFFPGPWMRSFKKQLSRPRLESFMGPRVEFFRILFEQAYHPEFHEFSTKKNLLKTKKNQLQIFTNSSLGNEDKNLFSKTPSDQSQNTIENPNSIYWDLVGNKQKRNLKERSALRKFVRKVNNRVQIAKIQNIFKNNQNFENSLQTTENLVRPISSKQWKFFETTQNRLFQSNTSSSQKTQLSITKKSEENTFFQRFSKKLFLKNTENISSVNIDSLNKSEFQTGSTKHLSKKDRFLERYKTFLNSNTNQQQTSKVFQSTGSPGLSTNSSLESVQNENHFRSLTLLHPLQFYFQKEQALKRKFQFYGVKLFRNFGVENNSPYFRVMMKRFFYHFKPTLRWERTLRVATMRRARRKSSRIPRKFNVQKNSQILANIDFATSSNSSGMISKVQNESQVNSRSLNENANALSSLSEKTKAEKEVETFTKPTHFYSLVDKRASRYRYQIYKDVLQHWYYSPLNRFLVKLDVDSFIRRQPNSYFLTKNDEKLLHLKRQLLSEYYETLRWYTYMQHYSTMKNQIGGTKSLSNRAYNQQFAGTFKKIRHLFNVTPSFDESTVLKFDQPLYNEYSNTQKNSLFHETILHEELLADDFFMFGKNQTNNFSSNEKNPDQLVFPEDLQNQSATILREYLKAATPLRQEYIQQLVNEKNSWEFTKFLFRGQKTRGTSPVANETDFLNQEKNYLLTDFHSSETKSMKTEMDTSKLKDEMWITLLQKCQNKLYDQEAIKNYVSLKKEKYEIQKQRHEKYLKNRIERMKQAIVLLQFNKQNPNTNQLENLSGYTSSIRKALKESVLWEKNNFGNSSNSTNQSVENIVSSISPSPRSSSSFREGSLEEKGQKKFLHKINIRKNRFSTNGSDFSQTDTIEVFPVTKQKLQSNLFKKNIQNSFKKKAISIVQAENSFKRQFSKTKENHKKTQNFVVFTLLKPIQKTKNIFWSFFHPNTSFSEDLDQDETFKKPKKKNLFSNVFRKFPFVFKRSSYIENTFENNIDFWKKRENALSKRKKVRKTLKRLRNQKSVNDKILFEKNDFSKSLPEKNISKPSREKNDMQYTSQMNETSSDFLQKQKFSHSESWKKYVSPSTSFKEQKKASVSFDQQSENTQNFEKGQSEKSFVQKILSFQKNFFTKKFQRRRSRLRRYSSFKGRGPIKKRTLREKLKRQFKYLKKYGRNEETGKETVFDPNQKGPSVDQIQKQREKKKVELIQFITQRNYEPNGDFSLRDQKQRRTRQIKHRAWKKKKQNFAQKRRKLRKRRRSTVSKIRVFNKKLHRILSKQEIQKWWFGTFFPNFQQTTEKTWQLEKNSQIRKQLGELSEQEILERDQTTQQKFQNNTTPNSQGDKFSSLQIGDKDYKPLALPESLRIREKLVQKGILRFHDQKETNIQPSTSKTEPMIAFSTPEKNQRKSDVFEKTNNFVFSNSNAINTSEKSKFFVGTNPIPFYAGWDESLRKFVITNRLLSRQNCFSCSQNGLPFTKAPLQGMNAATTLYWQIPFTTYDPDQFFALGMDGFSPLGWRHFSLKHSRQTTKPILVKNFLSFSKNDQNSQNLSKNLQLKFFKNNEKQNTLFKKKTEIDKNFEYRRILKKQKRIKKHPRPPVWFPSGSLSQQVLPVHYIYVFYKRSRLPRDRYIRRRLRSNFLNNQTVGDNSFITKMTDFTLRKRTKPRRKYHRKRFVVENNQFLLRRRKFRGFFEENDINRPSSKLFQTSKQEKRNIQMKQKRKGENEKTNENLRVRQLRRRVQRQVYRPIWRYKPRAGGFVWPGDYLRLELVKAPQLNTFSNTFGSPEESFKTENKQTGSRKIRKKKRRTLQEWQIQPKKYLLEKHNRKVLKKRFEKSLNIHQ